MVAEWSRFWTNWLREIYIGLVVLLVRQLLAMISDSEKQEVTKQVVGDSLQNNKTNVQE